MKTPSRDVTQAKFLLRHYIAMGIEGPPVKMSSDSFAEIGDIVDHIVRAAVEQVRAEFEAMHQQAQIRETTRRMTEGPR